MEKAVRVFETLRIILLDERNVKGMPSSSVYNKTAAYINTSVLMSVSIITAYGTLSHNNN